MFVIVRRSYIASTVLFNKFPLSSLTLNSYVKCKNVLSSSFHSLFSGKLGINGKSQNGNTVPEKIVAKHYSVKNKSQKKEWQDSYHVNTNIQNNVLLYKLDWKWYKPFIVCVIISAIFQFAAYYLYTPMFWTNERETNVIVAITYKLCLSCAISGFVTAIIPFIICAKNVRHIILHKGGQMLTVTTYNLFKWRRNIVVPLKDITSAAARDANKNTIPLKVRGRLFSLIIHSNGEFYNRGLYDYTLGRRRRKI